NIAATSSPTFAGLTLSSPLTIGSGGTGQTTAASAFNALSPMTTLGDVIYGAASGAGTRLVGNTTTTKKFLTQTGVGTNSAAPAWGTLSSGDIPNNAANTTGTSSNVTGVVTETHGSTNQNSYTTGDILYGSASNTLSKLGGNTTTTKKFLTQ